METYGDKFGYPGYLSYIYVFEWFERLIKIKVMIKKFIKKYTQEIDLVAGFLFIAATFYLLYFTLWVVCPC